MVFQDVHFWKTMVDNHVRHGRQDDFTLDIVVDNFQSTAYNHVHHGFPEYTLLETMVDNHVRHGFPEYTLLETIGRQWNIIFNPRRTSWYATVRLSRNVIHHHILETIGRQSKNRSNKVNTMWNTIFRPGSNLPRTL